MTVVKLESLNSEESFSKGEERSEEKVGKVKKKGGREEKGEERSEEKVGKGKKKGGKGKKGGKERKRGKKEEKNKKNRDRYAKKDEEFAVTIFGSFFKSGMGRLLKSMKQ